MSQREKEKHGSWEGLEDMMGDVIRIELVPRAEIGKKLGVDMQTEGGTSTVPNVKSWTRERQSTSEGRVGF